MTDATYIVQSKDESGFWSDVATITAPARTKRRKIIGLALAESGLRPEVGGEPLRLRVLDAASAHVTSVSAVAVDPKLEIA